MFPCESVALDFLQTAPYRFVNSIDLPISPRQLWDVLTDAEAWPQWDDVTRAAWTSPEPHRVGSTRTFEISGGVVGTAEFIAWNPHHHLAFRITESSSQRTGGSAEEYRIEPTEHGCRLTWTLARSPIDLSWMKRKLGPRIMASTRRRALSKLRDYTNERFGASI
jgi:Polyketide cyclase / dehydrase and lipid transport